MYFKNFINYLVRWFISDPLFLWLKKYLYVHQESKMLIIGRRSIGWEFAIRKKYLIVKKKDFIINKLFLIGGYVVETIKLKEVL